MRLKAGNAGLFRTQRGRDRLNIHSLTLVATPRPGAESDPVLASWLSASAFVRRCTNFDGCNETLGTLRL